MLAIVEKTATGYHAATGKPLEAEATGDTREEALARLGRIVSARLAQGVELVELTVPEAHPLAPFAGDMKDNPLFAEWVAEMKAYRAEMEAQWEAQKRDEGVE